MTEPVTILSIAGKWFLASESCPDHLGPYATFGEAYRQAKWIAGWFREIA